MLEIPEPLKRFHGLRKPRLNRLAGQQCRSEFWLLDELESLNTAYCVEEFAAGCIGFASSGGGEMFAFGPSGTIVCLAFCAMLSGE